MSVETSKSEYMLLVRGSDLEKRLPTDLLKKAMDDLLSWVDRLATDGILKGAQPLEPIGRILSMGKSKLVADGPFTETKEAIGGYFILLADSLDEAVEIAKQHPLLPYDIVVEVRPLVDLCPSMRLVGSVRTDILSATTR